MDSNPEMRDMLSDPDSDFYRMAANDADLITSPQFMRQVMESGIDYSGMPIRRAKESGGNVTAVHDAKEWDELLSKPGLALVDFYATWCSPCQMAAPVVEQWSLKYLHVAFLKVDVEQCRRIAQSEGISSMPTFKLYENGKEVRRGGKAGGRGGASTRRLSSPLCPKTQTATLTHTASLTRLQHMPDRWTQLSVSTE